MDTNNQTEEKPSLFSRQVVRFIAGIVIVAIGLVTLARTTGYADLQFQIVWPVVWPVVIVVAGLSLISRRGWVSNLISAAATIFVVWVVALMLVGSPRIAEFNAVNSALNFGPWKGLNGIKGVERLGQVEKCLRLLGTSSLSTSSLSQ